MDSNVDWHSPYSVMIFVLPWIVSVLGIWMTHLTGHKDQRGWMVGVLLQLVWLIFVIMTQAWGFLFLTAVRTYQYVQNYRRWKKEGAALTAPDDPQAPPSKLF